MISNGTGHRAHRASLTAASIIATAGGSLGTASAEVTFRYVAAVAGESIGEHVEIVPGGEATVLIMLEESAAAGGSSLLVGADGLFSAEFGVARVDAVPGQPLALITAIESNRSAFDDPFGLPEVDLALDGSAASVVQFADLLAGAGPTGDIDPLAIGVRRVLLGTMTLAVPLGAEPGQLTGFEISDPPEEDNTVTFDLAVAPLDSRIAPHGLMVEVANPQACAADLAEPIGVLDVFDVLEYVTRFAARDLVTDFAAPFGRLDIYDILTYFREFLGGC